MGLVLNSLSGSKAENSTIGITGSVRIGLPRNIEGSSIRGELPAMPEGTTFFVSGSTAGHTDRAAFGGDVVVSGSLHTVGTVLIDGFLGRHGDSGTYLQFGTPTALADDNISLSTSGKPFFHADGDAQHVYLGRAGKYGWTANKASKVYILSGGAGASPDRADRSDVSFYVSGTNTAWGSDPTEGVSLIDGTLLVSGTIRSEHLRVDGNILHNYPFNNSYTAKFMGGLSGSLTQLPDGTSYLVAGSNVTITSASNGQVTIASSGGGGGDIDGSGAATRIAYWSDSDTLTSDADLTFDGNTLTVNKSLIVNNAGGNNDFRVESANNEYALLVDADHDRVLVLSGGSGNSANEADGSDVAFYVSGTISSQGSSARGTSLFGGDALVSGSLFVGAGTRAQNTLALVVGDKADAGSAGADYFVWVSGSKGSIGSSTDRGVTVFGGDAFVSGALVVGTPPGESTDGSLSLIPKMLLG